MKHSFKTCSIMASRVKNKNLQQTIKKSVPNIHIKRAKNIYKVSHKDIKERRRMILFWCKN